MKKIATLVLALALSVSANSEEKQTSTDAFRGETQYRLLMCQLQVKIAINKIELGESNGLAGVGDCIKNAKASVKKVFGPALKVASKGPVASKLIKDYYASWLTTIDGVLPGTSERKVDYERRQLAAESKSDEYWNRFEVEAGL
jgi:hypothetical protein